MKKLTLIIAGALLFGSIQAQAADPNRMTFEQYTNALAGFTTRETSGLDSKTTLDAEIAELRAQLAATHGEIDATWGQIYGHLESNENSALAYAAGLETLKADIMGLNELSGEELVERHAAFVAVEARFNAAASQPLAKLSASAAQLNEMANVLAAVKSRLERAANAWYSVLRGDCLWTISGQEKVYADPFQWTRLYSANREQIADPDMIFPDQRLAVPKLTEKGQYLVQKGDSFVSIAEATYGEATKWRSIQEANMSLVDSMGGLFPGMILLLP
jgi:hypothetical protein